ncbi:MAG: hypothetical protein ACLQVA_01160 [Candidatus Brocadiia bacterium]
MEGILTMYSRDRAPESFVQTFDGIDRTDRIVATYLIEYAKKPKNKELRRALERWNRIERPMTPWPRIAPKHIRRVKFAA